MGHQRLNLDDMSRIHVMETGSETLPGSEKSAVSVLLLACVGDRNSL